jgi:HK97 gp10 family phage protein
VSRDGVKIEVKVNLGGVPEKLSALPTKLARRVMRKALKAVGLYWIGELKSRVPILSGELRDSIDQKVSVRDEGQSGTVTVGPTWGRGKGNQSPGLYAMFVEFGLRVKRYPMQPFMRPTFDATAEKATKLFADTLKGELEAATKD